MDYTQIDAFIKYYDKKPWWEKRFFGLVDDPIVGKLRKIRVARDEAVISAIVFPLETGWFQPVKRFFRKWFKTSDIPKPDDELTAKILQSNKFRQGRSITAILLLQHHDLLNTFGFYAIDTADDSTQMAQRLIDLAHSDIDLTAWYEKFRCYNGGSGLLACSRIVQVMDLLEDRLFLPVMLRYLQLDDATNIHFVDDIETLIVLYRSGILMQLSGEIGRLAVQGRDAISEYFSTFYPFKSLYDDTQMASDVYQKFSACSPDSLNVRVNLFLRMRHGLLQGSEILDFLAQQRDEHCTGLQRSIGDLIDHQLLGGELLRKIRDCPNPDSLVHAFSYLINRSTVRSFAKAQEQIRKFSEKPDTTVLSQIILLLHRQNIFSVKNFGELLRLSSESLNELAQSLSGEKERLTSEQYQRFYLAIVNKPSQFCAASVDKTDHVSQLNQM